MNPWNASPGPTLRHPSKASWHAVSQSMSKFLNNLNAQRDRLQLTVAEVAAELNRRGIPVAYQTVVGWFNGNRGARWKVEELKALLDILQTDLQAMSEGEAELVEDPVPAATAKEMKGLTAEQQQAILAMVRSMRSH